MIVEFTVPGDPMGKERPKFAGHAYTPVKTRAYEELVRVKCKAVYHGEPLETPIKMVIVARFSIPKSTSGAKRIQMLMRKLWPTKRPDWDNIGKIVCDALNGVAYKDDAQVVDARVVKIYSGGEAMVGVRLEEM